MTEAGEPEYLIRPVPVDGTVFLAEPDPEWAEWYARGQDRIRTTLGSRALAVEHAGSTSAPGLVAKPIIDIVLVVTDSSAEASYLPDLQDAGYLLKLREPGWHEHRLFIDHEPDVQIHIFSVGSSEVERMLVFRDRLRRSSPGLG